MTEHDHDETIERILQLQRPMGPPEDLRRRVLFSAGPEPGSQLGGPWRGWLVGAAAAAIVLAVGLRIVPIGFVVAFILGAPEKGL